MERRSMPSRVGHVVQLWDMERDATLRLPRSRRGLRVQVRAGSLVVTRAGDPEDHVLGAGDVLDLPPGGLAVAWALQPSVLALGEARPAARMELARSWA